MVGTRLGFYCLLVLCILAVAGCGKKADENKPLSEVTAEAEKMNADQLRAMAVKYKEAITAKKEEIEKVAGKLKDISITEKLGAEAKELTTEIGNLTKSVSSLKERFEVYYKKLKEVGGDLSDLKV